MLIVVIRALDKPDGRLSIRRYDDDQQQKDLQSPIISRKSMSNPVSIESRETCSLKRRQIVGTGNGAVISGVTQASCIPLKRCGSVT